MATAAQAPKASSIWGWLLAVCAAGLLLLTFGEVFSRLANTSFYVPLATDSRGAYVKGATKESNAWRAGLRDGDRVDVERLSLAQRFRLYSGSPVGTTIALPIVRDGRARTITVTSQEHEHPLFGDDSNALWATLVNALVALSIFGFIAFRRPSLQTAALVLYGCSMTTPGVVSQFSWLPDGPYVVVATAIVTLFSDLPLLALLPFITRFPEVPTTAPARLRMHLGDGIFVVSFFILLGITIFEPVMFKSWHAIHVLIQLIAVVATLVLATLAFRAQERGNSRRRIAWVIAGYIVSSISYVLFLLVNVDAVEASSGYFGEIAAAIFQLSGCALPIALAYAVLRHRVLGIVVAWKLTVLYGFITSVVILMVSVVHWLSELQIGKQHLSPLVDAAVSIGFGAALSWIHSRVEPLVERAVFHRRHVAKQRFDARIEALGFAKTESVVDESLVDDASDILELVSAAVFRRSSANSPLQRVAARNWADSDAQSLDDESVLVRELTALEKPIFLSDLAIRLPAAPEGSAQPVLACPISTQHELLGVVLYGNGPDDAAVDPDEVQMLALMANTAAVAYRVIEAQHLRERVTALELASKQKRPSRRRPTRSPR